MIWCIKTYIIVAYVKIQKNEDILSSMSNLQPNWCLEIDFQNVDQHAGGKWLIHDTRRHVARTISCKAWNSPAEYPSWVARSDTKGSDGTMLNPIFWKKVQGQKHPGRWGIVEHQIPSIKVLFKTNAKSHMHPGIKLLSSESKTQLVNQWKQNYYIRAYIYDRGHQEETHHPTHMFRRLFLDLLSMGWRWCASAMGAIKPPPSCSSPKIMCQPI